MCLSHSFYFAYGIAKAYIRKFVAIIDKSTSSYTCIHQSWAVSVNSAAGQIDRPSGHTQQFVLPGRRHRRRCLSAPSSRS